MPIFPDHDPYHIIPVKRYYSDRLLGCAAVPNGVPDECQGSPDCQAEGEQGHGIPDVCELSCGPPGGPCDIQGCGVALDCTGNCVPDECDIASGTTEDCNVNGVPDECEIAGGAACDIDGNGVPDECGACCDTGPCLNTLPENCPAETFFEGLTCAECACELGACCDGSLCNQMTDCDCEAVGGHFVHDDCSPNPCEIGSCCTDSGCQDRQDLAIPCDPNIIGTCMDEERCYNITEEQPPPYIGGARCSDDPCAEKPAPAFFVDDDALPEGDGLTWDNAFADLQEALDAAGPCGGPEIWVADGTYYPSEAKDPTETRTATFELHKCLRIYGGFVGTEKRRSQRNVEENETILSGDIGDSGDASDNSYHVVTSLAGVLRTTVLDGFTITAGNANNGLGADAEGGGIFIDMSLPTIVNCKITGNSAIIGGGVTNWMATWPTFINPHVA